jgi:membrane fusion protein, heavy metal efflux system
MRSRYVYTLLAAGLALATRSAEVSGHEGHDHGAPAASISVAAMPRAEAASDLFELVAVSRGGELILYVDRFASNEPVSDAEIQVETPAGSIEARARPDGTYVVAAPWSATPGRYDLIFTVSENATADVLLVSLEIPSGMSGNLTPGPSFITTAFANGIKERLARNDPAIVVAVLGGFLAGLLVMALLRRRRNRAHASLTIVLLFIALATSGGSSTWAHEGDGPAAPASASRDTAQRLPDGSVFVPKSTQRILAIRTVVTEPAAHRRAIELPGRIIPDPNASGYVQTSVGGRLTPPAAGFPRLGTLVKKGDALAYVTPPLQAIDVSDMRQRQGELDQQISIVERRLARYEQLAPGGAVARSQLEDTRLELKGLQERRTSLDKVRREPEALLAPVDGVIADGNPIAGQIAQTNAVVFHIVDPERLWVEALSFEALSGTQSARTVIGGRPFTLSYRGSGFADRNQSIPIHFAVEGGTTGLRAGQFVTVLAATDEEKSGLAVPRASLVRSTSGQELVYEHVSAERFEPRQVRAEALDGERVFIATGVAAGKRVVVQGAELLDHIR